MNSENINDIILVRDVLLQGVLKHNKSVSKSEVRYGVRGDYGVFTFSKASGLSTNSVDDVQAFVAEELGRKVYVDPQYVAGVAATFRVKLRS